MWKIKNLKTKARGNVKKNYFSVVFVCLINLLSPTIKGYFINI